jgi:hypothetical protein
VAETGKIDRPSRRRSQLENNEPTTITGRHSIIDPSSACDQQLKEGKGMNDLLENGHNMTTQEMTGLGEQFGAQKITCRIKTNKDKQQ